MPVHRPPQAGKRKVIHLRGLAQGVVRAGGPSGRTKKLLLTVAGAAGFLLLFFNANHSLSHAY